jgi:plastocyanin
MGKPAERHLVAAMLLLASFSRLSSAQSVTDRTPNLDDGWTVRPGVIQFNFLHRFEVSAPPARKVTSFPNFHLATGLPLGVNFGLDYATNSTVFSGIPNEYQLTLRRPVLREAAGSPLDVGVVAGYNFAPQSADGEVTVARHLGPVRLLGTVRGMSSGYDVQRSLWGAGGGAVVRVTSWLSLAGDVFSLANAPDDATGATAWGAGAQLRIPYSPHSFSIQITGARELRVRAGTRVRWVNDDQLQHSVTADDHAFDSGLIDAGRGFEHVFDRPGSYSYHCTPHPFMHARVIVEP